MMIKQQLLLTMHIMISAFDANYCYTVRADSQLSLTEPPDEQLPVHVQVESEKREVRLYDRMLLWARGDINGRHNDDEYNRYLKLGPVRQVRKEFLNHCIEFECQPFHSFKSYIMSLRGGSDVDLDAAISSSSTKSYQERLQSRLDQLVDKYGQAFQDAIQLNEKEHAEDCEISCQSFYCASSSSDTDPSIQHNETSFISYNFGSVPPEDFAGEFGFPLDLIKVSQGKPLFSAHEALNVIKTAENEGVDKNEYTSGKYRLGGDWLINLPKTRAWFNQKLETTFFPLLKQLFPEVVTSTSVLRAHSVSLLKYNSSHPRTDVHIDNGILALTVAMTPQDEYLGGGTFFEHMPNPIQMDVGHVTMRPGSVRHGGHKVTKGTRYILGAFLLIKDRVEHVRRLKNRGSELRRKQDFVNAKKHFEWALAINPKCATCLKDWAEILMAEKKWVEAELKIREALRLVENRDSDALFSLGIILSEIGKDEESIDAYTKSVEINADDAELCYNLGIKFGEKGDTKREMTMYARATQIDPKFGGAWLNWGTTLAELGNIDDAEVMFLNAIKCHEVKSKAMMNLALVYIKKGEGVAAKGELNDAKDLLVKAAEFLDNAKLMLDDSMSKGSDPEVEKYSLQFRPLRLQTHRLVGSVLFGLKDFEACEDEFRKATQNFPDIQGAWEMLARVLELQGKTDELDKIRETINQLRQ